MTTFAWLAVIALAACGPTGSEGRGTTPGTELSQAGRRLVLVAQAEPDSLAAKSLRRTGGRRINATLRVFNAGLAIHDDGDADHPYLAEALPALGTDSWRVMSDGRTETTYRLRPGLAWHDGTPLAAEDFVFAWRVYATPDLGVAGIPPLNYLEEVSAPDDRTVIFRWQQPYLRGGNLEAEDFQPLPRHILQRVFEQGNHDSLISHPFWGAEYVGLGPYRLDRWEQGTFVEGSANPTHALGRPKIDRIRLLFMSDPNTVVAGLLSGDIQVTIDDPIRMQQAVILQREWEARGVGKLLLSPAQVRHYQVQLKPEFASPASLVDVRVRRAIVHAIDRQTIADGLLDNQGNVAHTMMSPKLQYFADIDRAITKYPYDPRRTEQLMGEAGFIKAGDGVFASPSEGRFSLDVRINAAGQNEAEGVVVADSLQRNGIDTSVSVLPQALTTDAQFRASFPGLTGSGNILTPDPPSTALRSSEIPTPENRWRGSNRGGWSNAEFDRLLAAYDTTLDRDESNRLVVQMMKLLSEELPLITMYYNLGVQAHAAALHGPLPSTSTDGAIWNIHEWTW